METTINLIASHSHEHAINIIKSGQQKTTETSCNYIVITLPEEEVKEEEE